MILTNNAIISSIQKRLAISEDRASHLMESVLEIMRSTLANGEEIKMPGFGRFSVHKKAKRKGGTSDSMIKTGRTVSFRCSPILRGKLNGPEWVQCSKCQSRGVKRYKYYIISNILKDIIRIKSGSPPEGDYKSDLILLCSVCKGDGMIDWVTNMLGHHPFRDLNGCLELFMKSYWNRVFQRQVGMKWKGLYFINGISPWNPKKRMKGVPDLEQVIEASRKRYMGPFKLNKHILGVDIKDLKIILNFLIGLEGKVADFDPNYVRSLWSSLGLTEYVPDVYACPIEDDFL